MNFNLRKLTSSSDENAIASIFKSGNVLNIPYFQRAYKWTEKNIRRYEEDLDNLLDDDSTHFMGAIIIYRRGNSNPSDATVFEVVDGQQRLTTFYLSMLALAKTFAEKNDIEDAKGVVLYYLIITKPVKLVSNAILQSCKEDRAGINRVFKDLLETNNLKEILAKDNYKYKQLDDTGNKEGTIWKNYKLLRKYFESRFLEAEKQGSNGIEILKEIYQKMTCSITVVQIVVNDPMDGPKIFDSLNSKQHPMTIGDLVRNEVFSKVYDTKTAEEIDELDKKYWHPFYERFGEQNKEDVDCVFEKYFFPYVLTQDPSITKSNAFSFLKQKWSATDDPKEIIHSLEEYQDIFIDLMCGTNFTYKNKQDKKNISDSIHRFYEIGTPTAVYPFLLRVIRATVNGVIDDKTSLRILELIESFLIRRAVCGFEPTGLHQLFKSLWQDLKNVYTEDKVKEVISKHSTVKWPSNEEFANDIAFRPLADSKVTTFLLSELDKTYGADHPNDLAIQIEHILPQTPAQDSQWLKDWSKKEIQKYLNCLPNLLPLSEKLNKSAQNGDYVIVKRELYTKSAWSAPRKLATTYAQWTPKEFKERAKLLAKWAVERWPHHLD